MLWQILLEMIELDIDIGDVVLTGKFKNKRKVVKDIGTDEYGQPTINGTSILKIKIEKLLPKSKWSAKSRAELEEEEQPLTEADRDYKAEYKKYGATKSAKKDRAARNRNRRNFEKSGRVKKGDGKEIDHKKPLSKGGGNGDKNLRVVDKKTNRKKGTK